MIPANLDPKVEIKEKERHCYHVKMTYRSINPNDPTHPVVKEGVRAFRKQDYIRIFGGNEKQRQHAKEVAGFDTAEVVHDPTLLPRDPEVITGPIRFTEPVKTEVLTDEEKKRIETEKAELAAKEKAIEAKEEELKIEAARLAELAKKEAEKKVKDDIKTAARVRRSKIKKAE